MTRLAQARSDTVSVKTQELRYERHDAADGQHDPVVMLHPWFGCTRFWDHTVAALADRERFVVDLYSLGAKPGWQEFAGPVGLSHAVEAFVDALGLERFCLIGNSMGGIAAQELASHLGARISKLILVGTGARIVGVKPAWRKAMDDWMAGEADRAFTTQMVDALIARRPKDARAFESFVDAVAAANKAFMGAVLTTAYDLDLRPVLPHISAPTLVVRGELDAARTPEHVAELMSGIPNAPAHEIPNARHAPQVDSPDAFCPLVRAFLDS
jgi:pimeloyl-ACP methyl ester carboxylesterase